MSKSDGDLETEKQLHASDFFEQIGAATKLSPAAFNSFADAIETKGSPNENLMQLFELRHRLTQ